MLTSSDIEAMRDHIKDNRAERLSVVEFGAQFSCGFEVIAQATRDEWLEILDLAAMAARIRER